jgi:hypothetical protein
MIPISLMNKLRFLRFKDMINLILCISF